MLLGRTDRRRIYRYVRRDYTIGTANLDKYKIFTPKADEAALWGKSCPCLYYAAPGQGLRKHSLV